MTTLELLQWENEHKDNNFYEKGEDEIECGCAHIKNDKGAFNIRETKDCISHK